MIRKIAPGYYEIPKLPVTLIIGEYERVIETYAKAEISKREDGSGWSFILTADFDNYTARLSEHEDVYDRKRDIIAFFKSDASRIWKYVTAGGLNAWCCV